MSYYCKNCFSKNIVCDALVTLNNDVDEKGYYALDDVEELSSVFCRECESTKIMKVK